LQLGFVFAVAVHLLLNLAATFTFYRYITTLFSPAVALAGTMLLLLNFPLQQFNSFLQTESIFYSLTIMLSCYVLRQRSLTLRNGLIILGLLLLVSITRPTGLLFFPAVFLYLFFRFFRGIAFGWKIGIVAAAFAIFLFALNLALGSGGELDFLLPYREEHIICGLPTLVPGTSSAGDGNSLWGLLGYVTSHFGQFMHLAALRLTAFFGLIRSYYSPVHNIYLGVYFFSIYIGVVLSLGYWKKHHAWELLYFISIIFLMCATAMLTCDDWHNRFYLTIHPYINLLCLPFVARVLKKFTSK
jgi:hypothetical protein